MDFFLSLRCTLHWGTFLSTSRDNNKKTQPFQPSINKYIMIERVLENQSTVT